MGINTKDNLTEVRNSEIDIVKGASNVDQIDGLQENAKQNPNTNSSEKAQILEVNNGEGNENDTEAIHDEDLDNPASRGI